MLWKHHVRTLATLAALLAISGCDNANSTQPTDMRLDDFVIGLQTSDGLVVATQQGGTPPAANGGPVVTPTVSGLSSVAVVSGGSSVVRLRAFAPFQTVYLSVIDDPLDGYWKLPLAAPTTDVTVVVKFSPSIPENTFQTVFTVALGDAVGSPSSIANQVKTPTAVVVSGTSPSVGSTQPFAAAVSFADGTSQAATDQVVWQSSATSVAQVTSAGLVSGVAAGEADIRATWGTLTGSVRVTVASSGAGAFMVSGTVTDATSGGRLPGVTVTIGSKMTTTDANGSYALTGIAAGSVTVAASADGYVTGQQTLTLTANTPVNFVLVRVPSIPPIPPITPTVSILFEPPCIDSDPPHSVPWSLTCNPRAILVADYDFTNVAGYYWTYLNPGTGATMLGSSSAPYPVFPCSFSGFGVKMFTLDMTVLVYDYRVLPIVTVASAAATTTVTRATGVCGAP